MKFALLILFALAITTRTFAQDGVVVATKPMRAGAVIALGDVQPTQDDDETAELLISFMIGKAVKRSIYANAPIFIDDIEAPRVVERNEIVRIEYQSTLLSLSTEGRALDAGAVGDTIRIMNLSSKSIVAARVAEPGKVVIK